MLARIACFALGALVLGPASAHHSLAIYENETAVLEGEIVDVRWVNPHVEIKLRTTVDGKEQVWQLESGSLMTLQRSGVTRESLRESDHVKAFYRTNGYETLKK